jgi:hypothetical protein
MMLNRLFVKIVGLSFHDLKRSGGAFTQARAKSVAVFLRNKSRFAVNDFQRAFRAGYDALTAAVALFLVYFNDLPFGLHRYSPLYIVSIFASESWELRLRIPQLNLRICHSR